MSKHYNIRVFGQVQGVGFRFAVKQEAQRLGFFGFVKNDPYGTVYIEVEGEENNLQDFIEWCKKGPNWSEVERVEVEEGKIKNFINFDIK